MFFSKNSKFLPGMLLGAAVGAMVGAGGLLMTNPKKIRRLRRAVCAMGRKLAGQVQLPT